jgi:anti-sigma28 factor (negative regulator of flagellin synthesis)
LWLRDFYNSMDGHTSVLLWGFMPIRSLTVLENDMKLSQLLQCNSVKSANLAASNIGSSFVAQAWYQYREMVRSGKYAMKSDNAMRASVEAERQFTKAVSNYWQLDAVLHDRGFEMNLEQSIEFCTGATREKSDDAKLAEAARIRGVTVESLKSQRQAQRDAKAAANKELIEGFMGRFEEGKYDVDSDADFDPEYSAVKILASFQKSSDRIAGYDNIDLAELMFIKLDMELIDTIAARELDYTESANEASRESDDKGATAEDLAQGSN